MYRFLIIFPLLLSLTISGQDATSGDCFADFYVATDGNDGWSGTLAEPNKDGTDGPFATISRAKEAVRVFKHNKYRDIYVMIRGGEYTLSKTVTFTANDGHYDSYPIHYMAYPDEEPVFNSDVPVEGWTLPKRIAGLPEQARGHVWVAPIPKLPEGKRSFNVLYDDGVMQTRAHSAGFEPRESVKGGDFGGVDPGSASSDRNLLYFNKGELRSWDNLEDVEIFVEPIGYVSNYLPLDHVDEERLEARTSIPATYPIGRITRRSYMFPDGNYRVENALTYLDEPGEWVVNTRVGKIYYWPVSGKPGKVVVPGLIQYFLVDGHEEGSVVRDISFEGLCFTRADRENLSVDDIGLQHDWDMWNKANAMMRFRDVEYCAVKRCRFTESGSAGVRFDLHAQFNVIQDNLIENLGGTGILLCGYGPGKKNVNLCNRIINNHIHHCGRLLCQSIGIMVWQSGENIIKNNKLHDLPYDAIALSGVRPMHMNMTVDNRESEGTLRRFDIDSEAQYQKTGSRKEVMEHYFKVAPYSLTRNNLVEDNDIFCTMSRMHDGNAIYLSDVGFGNVIRRNYVHHLHGQGMAQAIRTDAFIKETEITENVIYNCNGGGINVKYFENNVHNNIIADIHDVIFEDRGKTDTTYIGFLSLLEVYAREEMPPHKNLEVSHNIFYKTHRHLPFYRPSIVGGKKVETGLEKTDIDSNLYFDVGAEDKGESSLKAYQRRGVDASSIAADPMFVDLKNGDFGLKEGSPAYKIGFKDINTSRIGLTEDFPEKYSEAVKRQLGDDYDSFRHLEEICAGAATLD